MAQHKIVQLEQVKLENVSLQVADLDPVLKSVDLEIPMDQTLVVQSTDPTHAVHFLELLAGKKSPQSGKVLWFNSEGSEELEKAAAFYEVVGCYFDSQRPAPQLKVSEIFKSTEAKEAVIAEAVEQFQLQKILSKKFVSLSYETQKLVMLILATVRVPQMLILEDPAVGLKEELFLNFLDWIQFWQRQGHLRHIVMTNNHPTAARHFESLSLFIDEGLIYVEDQSTTPKKAYHF